MEKRRGRRGQTSQGEERGNDIGKVVIAHGSIEFCGATSIGLAGESKESLYGRETDRDLRNANLRNTYGQPRATSYPPDRTLYLALAAPEGIPYHLLLFIILYNTVFSGFSGLRIGVADAALIL